MTSRAELDRLDALLSVERLVRDAGDPAVLAEVARRLGRAMGFRSVVINLYRPAWDALEVVAVHGPPAARDQLLGVIEPMGRWSDVLDDVFLEHGTHFVRQADQDGRDMGISHVPDLPVREELDAWHPDDLLLVTMRDGAGELLGILSVDEPLSGNRPQPSDLKLLAVAAGHLAIALERGAEARRAAGYRHMVEQLLRVSARLNSGDSTREVLDAVSEGIAGALGFERIAVLLRGEDEMLRPRSSTGWDGRVPIEEVPRAALEPMVAPDMLTDGCALLERDRAEALAPPGFPRAYSSRRNGAGARAWRGHWLIVPLRDEQQELIGVIWADDPHDRLLPSRERLQALRLFADQAVSALQAAARLEALTEAAERDALTGLANRRGLRAFPHGGLSGGVSVLACDLDRFKLVNDELGHEIGDQVLTRFAGLLTAMARSSDLAVRMGGEEFAVVMPGTDETAAMAVAERIRAATAEHFADVRSGLTVSIGVASAPEGGARQLSELISRADGALYEAKRMGRNRCVGDSNRAESPAFNVTALRPRVLRGS